MSQGTKFCKHCGQIIDSDCVVCPKCGKQVENLNSYGGNGNGPIIINNNNNNNNNNFMGGYNSVVSPKSWLVTLLLCLFVAVFGIHRFYAGKIGTGIIMILLCWTGISAIWALVDLIMIILSKFKDGQGLLIQR